MGGRGRLGYCDWGRKLVEEEEEEEGDEREEREKIKSKEGTSEDRRRRKTSEDYGWGGKLVEGKRKNPRGLLGACRGK